MSENIILKNHPITEFQLLDNEFLLVDGQTERNTDSYAYQDVQSIELNMAWYPRLAKWLRYSTWLINGAPLVEESCKKANLVINIRKTKLKIWLTDSDMVDKAKRLVKLLNTKAKLGNV